MKIASKSRKIFTFLLAWATFCASGYGQQGKSSAVTPPDKLAYEGVPQPLDTRHAKQFVNTYLEDAEVTIPEGKYPIQRNNIKDESLYHGVEVGSNKWIRMACDEAHQSVKDGGGPFGAVIVQIDNESNKVIRYWRCRNQVVNNNDPTAHAEVNAVRMVAHELGVVNLGEIHRDNPRLKLPQSCEVSRCEIYSSCEPCPMCYAAIRWARIDTIVFAATRYDAAEPGVNFSDLDLYRELAVRYADRTGNGLRVYQATTDNSLNAFNLWKNTEKVEY